MGVASVLKHRHVTCGTVRVRVASLLYALLLGSFVLLLVQGAMVLSFDTDGSVILTSGDQDQVRHAHTRTHTHTHTRTHTDTHTHTHMHTHTHTHTHTHMHTHAHTHAHTRTHTHTHTHTHTQGWEPRCRWTW